MKTITIGRGDGANIIIDNELISRRHAILKISTFGKMEIVDMGRNGTYVNGIKLRPNVPFPVTRKDVVKFADQDSPFKLDWSLVPDNSRFIKIALSTIIGLLAVILLVLLIRSCISDEDNSAAPTFIEETSAQSPSANSSEAPAIDSEKKSGVAEESREREAKENIREKKEEQKDINGKTVQQLFPNPPAKKDTNSKKKENGAVQPSKVKTKEGDNNQKNNKTVIM